MDHANSRTRVLEAAKPLFVARGYRGLSMRELGEAVGVSKAAIYYHFRDKESLFSALIEEAIAQLEALIVGAEGVHAEARGRVEHIVRSILTLPVDERAMIRVAMQDMAHMTEEARQHFLEHYSRRFLGRLQAVFAAGIESGEFRALAPESATWTLLGMMYPYFYATDMAGGRASAQAAPEDQIDDMLTIFFDGVVASSN